MSYILHRARKGVKLLRPEETYICHVYKKGSVIHLFIFIGLEHVVRTACVIYMVLRCKYISLMKTYTHVIGCVCHSHFGYFLHLCELVSRSRQINVGRG